MKISKNYFCKRYLIVFVVLNTYFSGHWVENCGGDEKVNLVIFPFFSSKREQTGRGVSQFTCLSDNISHFSYV
jgi:hypothetical protein